jgi:hypothetical protein
MMLLPLDPPAWADDPSKYPTAGESASIVQAAISAASSYGPKRRVVEAARKARFKLSKAEKALIPTVGRYQQNAQPEVFAAYYVNLELAIACTTTALESNGRNIYGADPASAWCNDGPFGILWERDVTRDSYEWFGGMVDRGYTSNGVGPKQLTFRPLQKAADVRGGCWVPEHNCAAGNAFFIELIHQAGSVWGAFYAYNGAGAVAAAYANRAVGMAAVWRERLA